MSKQNNYTLTFDNDEMSILYSALSEYIHHHLSKNRNVRNLIKDCLAYGNLLSRLDSCLGIDFDIF